MLSCVEVCWNFTAPTVIRPPTGACKIWVCANVQWIRFLYCFLSKVKLCEKNKVALSINMSLWSNLASMFFTVEIDKLNDMQKLGFHWINNDKLSSSLLSSWDLILNKFWLIFTCGIYFLLQKHYPLSDSVRYWQCLGLPHHYASFRSITLTWNLIYRQCSRNTST